jgi:hypothetical protein
LAFKKTSNNFISQAKTSLKGKVFVALLTIIPNDNVQRSVKHKLDFGESKSNFKQKPS